MATGSNHKLMYRVISSNVIHLYHTDCVKEDTVKPVLSGHSKKTKNWLSIPIIT